MPIRFIHSKVVCYEETQFSIYHLIFGTNGLTELNVRGKIKTFFFPRLEIKFIYRLQCTHSRVGRGNLGT